MVSVQVQLSLREGPLSSDTCFGIHTAGPPANTQPQHNAMWNPSSVKGIVQNRQMHSFWPLFTSCRVRRCLSVLSSPVFMSAPHNYKHDPLQASRVSCMWRHGNLPRRGNPQLLCENMARIPATHTSIFSAAVRGFTSPRPEQRSVLNFDPSHYLRRRWGLGWGDNLWTLTSNPEAWAGPRQDNLMSICTSETQGKETALRFRGAKDLNVLQKNVTVHFFFFFWKSQTAYSAESGQCLICLCHVYVYVRRGLTLVPHPSFSPNPFQ